MLFNQIYNKVHCDYQLIKYRSLIVIPLRRLITSTKHLNLSPSLFGILYLFNSFPVDLLIQSNGNISLSVKALNFSILTCISLCLRSPDPKANTQISYPPYKHVVFVVLFLFYVSLSVTLPSRLLFKQSPKTYVDLAACCLNRTTNRTRFLLI